jgi:hemolysin III
VSDSETPSAPVHLPLVEESVAYEAGEIKPTWRGWIHLSTLPVAIAAGIVLIVLANGVPATVSSAVFVTSSILMLAFRVPITASTGPPRPKRC